MKLVYICSPLHGDVPENIRKANQYCEAAARLNVVPLAPHTIFTRYLNDDILEQRERGLKMGLSLLRKCDELWVCGTIISAGMRNEIKFARENSIPIKYMKEVSELSLDKTESKRLHTQKSIILQQYQPIYTNYYNITVDDNLGNFARICFDNGKELVLNGAEHTLDFLKMESIELKEAVGKIANPLIAEEQDKLISQLGLGKYISIHPIKDSLLPYFLLQECYTDLFVYCPIAQKDKFTVLIRGKDGQPFIGSDNNLFGFYSNQIANLEHIQRFHIPGLLEVLKDFEPLAVREYQEAVVIQKLDKMEQETGARSFVFFGNSGDTPLVSLPIEAEDYLTPGEMKIAEELVSRQEPEQSEITEEIDDQQNEETLDYDADLEEDFEMSM